MNRPLLLLLPVLAVVLMACPQKHTTASDTPPAPDPNGYVYDQQTTETATVTITTTETTTVTSNNTGGVITKDSVHVVGKPDTVIVGSKPDSIRTRFMVTFISKGAGIDYAAQARLDKWISENPYVKYSQTQWGREGEVDYCFFVVATREEEHYEGIGEIRGAIGTSDRVTYRYDVVCTHKHVPGVVAMPDIEEAPDAPKVDSSNIARVVVSFISKGQGTDYKTKERLANWLKEQNVEYEEKNWGREGETNVCIFLKGKTNRQQDIFVRDLRTFIGENELVLVEEWGKCDKRK